MLNKQLIGLEKNLGISTLVKIEEPFIQERGVELWLKRDDLLHPVISGNKWRKLKYILQHALSLSSHKIISMGGAYSNHLHALAYIGPLLGLKTEAKIRGEKHSELNSTLSDLMAWGMSVEYTSRSDYRQLRAYKSHDSLPGMQSGEYWLPEGGATGLALQGVAELIDEINIGYDVICVPCGTATTFAGLIKAVAGHKSVLGFAALKGAGFLTDDVKQLLNSHHCYNNNWSIQLDYHFGGFAKVSPDLLAFIRRFQLTHGIILEPVYTGKMLYGVYTLIRQGYFSPQQKIIAIHTGGLQGNREFFH